LNNLRVCLAFLIVLLSRGVLAESGDFVVVTVDEGSNRVLAGVNIEIESREGRTVSATTNAAGEARFEGLEEGFYRVEASAEGRR
jgi:hypothetical protein